MQIPHTLNPWLQFWHNSDGKNVSSDLIKLFLSAVGVMDGNLETDG